MCRHHGGRRSRRPFALDALVLAVAGVMATASLPLSAQAQVRIDLSEPLTCGGCSLSIAPSTVIYDRTGDAGLAGHPHSIARASTGDIFLASSQFEPMRFRATGEFIATVGRRGEGPGEYGAVRAVSIAGDTLFTYDSRLNRRSMWTLDGRYISADAIPPVLFGNFVVLNDGSYVISAPLRRPESIGFPFHRFDSRGNWRESFGPEVTVQDGDTRRLTRLLSPASNETFWASHRYEYTLEHFTAHGEAVATISRKPAWFPGPSDIRPVSLDAPPLPNVRSIRVDEQGLIWVLVTVADNNWRERLTESEAGDIFDYDGVFDSIIEVFDPRGWRLMASERFDPYFMGFIDDRHVAAYREDAFGVPIIEIFAIVLSNPELIREGAR
jgi:hypothetical protein